MMLFPIIFHFGTLQGEHCALQWVSAVLLELIHYYNQQSVSLQGFKEPHKFLFLFQVQNISKIQLDIVLNDISNSVSEDQACAAFT